jgi:hypothetical protein
MLPVLHIKATFGGGLGQLGVAEGTVNPMLVDFIDCFFSSPTE